MLILLAFLFAVLAFAISLASGAMASKSLVRAAFTAVLTFLVGTLIGVGG
ncbi:hypothetical protein [Ancylobacter pratisalsi]|uniref:Uncharacterized protein n=1 Tax=Ancylobacter pratisalsi TaxID=1745854 RepID=A0A6P1YNQ2_9HYPH|nr:hypothetical protein [Ancylobacter pratisalsi]QIB34765.1 hypothetical protein G3A50_14400 [Ancylobacter pratisalsi]